MKELYCGLDVSNKSISVCIIFPDGSKGKECTVPTSPQGLQRALKGLERVRCVVETGPLSETICEWVERLGHRIEILDARQAKLISASKRKTDKLDAWKLAQICRVAWYTPVHRKSGEGRALRTFLTARQRLVQTATEMHSTILGLLRAHGIVLGKTTEREFADRVRSAAQGLPETVVEAFEKLLDAWELTRKQADEMYKSLDRQISRTDKRIQLLRTIPGVGPATAAAFVSTIDDPRRFQSSEQVASYLGLVPSVYQSGTMEVRGRITKQGDTLLRWLLVEAAVSLLTRSKSECPLRKWGLELQQSKGFGKARVAVARKLACLMFHMLQTGEPFRHKAAA